MTGEAVTKIPALPEGTQADDRIIDLIADALTTAPWGSEPPTASHTEHRYKEQCALCQGRIEGIARVAAAAVQGRLDEWERLMERMADLESHVQYRVVTDPPGTPARCFGWCQACAFEAERKRTAEAEERLARGQERLDRVVSLIQEYEALPGDVPIRTVRLHEALQG